MATTSIWSVKGWLGKVVIYVENPDKTNAAEIAQGSEHTDMGEIDKQGLSDVIAYAVNEEKTKRKMADEKGVLMQQYVTGINCTPATARDEMLAVKKRYGKEDGIMAFHGYQSFAPGECTPQLAHEIGIRLAEELWGNRFQVLVATHLDKAHHLHNHFVVNSVSFVDGKRYHRSNQDYRDMRDMSDKLCREYQLSVIENTYQRSTRQYGEWRAEQEGKPTYRSMVKADVDDAIEKARTEKQFFHYMKEKGYSVKIGKDITVCPQGRERGLKLARNFGEQYTIEAIRKRILEETVVKTVKEPEQKKAVLRVYVHKKPTRKIGGLRGLYIYYCFLLGILPRNRPPVSTKQMHFLLKEDLTKLDRISKETRLLCRYHIDTSEQLFSFKESLEVQMTELCDQRKHLRYKCRSIQDMKRLEEVKAEIAGLTKQIKEIRKEVVLCNGIAARSDVIKEKFKTTIRNIDIMGMEQDF